MDRRRWSYAGRRTSGKAITLAASVAAAAALSGGSAALGQVSVTGPGTSVLIDFDNTVEGVNNGQHQAREGFYANPPLHGMDSDAWAMTGLSDRDFTFGDTCTHPDFTRGTFDGDNANVQSGGIYAMIDGGITTGVAFAIQPTLADWTPGTLTLRLKNNSAHAMTGFNLDYIAYVRNNGISSSSFNLRSSTNHLDYTNVSGTNISLVSAAAADTLGYRANNASATLGGFEVAPGGYFYLQWFGNDVSGTGERDEFALDNISLGNFTFATGARNLVWNSFPTGTWDAAAANQPWLDGASAASFTAADNVTFNEPTSDTTISVDAAGVTVGGFAITNSADTYTFSGGAIGGEGPLTKSGTGRVTFAADNAWTGGTVFSGGTIETLAAAALGTGEMVVTGGGGPGAVTLQTSSDLTLPGGITGDGGTNLTKTGAAKLTVGGAPAANAGAAIDITAGSVEMTSAAALGGAGSIASPAMAITLQPGTELLLNYGGDGGGGDAIRTGAGITLNSAALARPELAPDGDNHLSVYDSDAAQSTGGSLIINGDSTIRNLDVAAAAGDGPAPGNAIAIRMPVIVNPGATLTVHSANAAGDFEANAVAFRGLTDATTFPGDAVTIHAGGTIRMTGPGEKRFGDAATGKPVVGRGTGAGDAVLQLDARTFLTDIATPQQNITRLVVAGAGDGGLRIEAPMNATYAEPAIPLPDHPRPAAGTLGLFGLNATSTREGSAPPAGYEAIGNAYTVLSPRRYAQLSAAFASETLGGRLTLAATDASAATGVIDSGPETPVAIKLAIDNAATSGNHTYLIDPAANGGRFANFAGLVVQRTHPAAGTVTARLEPNGAAVLRTPSIDVAGARLDIADNKLVTRSPVGTAAGGAYSGVSGLIQSGRGSAGGDAQWNGDGITTSDPRAIHTSNRTAIGVIDASDKFRTPSGEPIAEADTATFAGQTVTGGDTLVMFTYGGDANLDGRINIDDYGRIDASVAIPGASGWASGDFNYDGVINIDDYGIIDSNISQQAFGTFAAAPGVAASTAAAGASAVPEPASLPLAALAAAALPSRRRWQILLAASKSADIAKRQEEGRAAARQRGLWPGGAPRGTSPRGTRCTAD